jgi:hypothetical protein
MQSMELAELPDLIAAIVAVKKMSMEDLESTVLETPLFVGRLADRAPRTGADQGAAAEAGFQSHPSRSNAPQRGELDGPRPAPPALRLSRRGRRPL